MVLSLEWPVQINLTKGRQHLLIISGHWDQFYLSGQESLPSLIPHLQNGIIEWLLLSCIDLKDLFGSRNYWSIKPLCFKTSLGVPRGEGRATLSVPNWNEWNVCLCHLHVGGTCAPGESGACTQIFGYPKIALLRPKLNIWDLLNKIKQEKQHIKQKRNVKKNRISFRV